MALIPWSPFGDLDRYFERMFGEEFMPVVPRRLFEPTVDVYQTAKSVVVEMPLVGVDPSRVDISVQDNVLSVKGSSEEKKEVKEKDYYRKEIRRGAFARSILLPAKVQEDGITAVADNGLLKITLPKTVEELKKKKKVKVEVKK